MNNVFSVAKKLCNFYLKLFLIMLVTKYRKCNVVKLTIPEIPN